MIRAEELIGIAPKITSKARPGNRALSARKLKAAEETLARAKRRHAIDARLLEDAKARARKSLKAADFMQQREKAAWSRVLVVLAEYEALRKDLPHDPATNPENMRRKFTPAEHLARDRARKAA